MTDFADTETRSVALVGVERGATPEEQRRAALHVADQATDAQDCRELLAMLGLLDTPIRSSRSVRNREHARASRARREEAT